MNIKELEKQIRQGIEVDDYILDYLVAEAEGINCKLEVFEAKKERDWVQHNVPTIDWNFIGKIIERDKIEIKRSILQDTWIITSKLGSQLLTGNDCLQMIKKWIVIRGKISKLIDEIET